MVAETGGQTAAQVALNDRDDARDSGASPARPEPEPDVRKRDRQEEPCLQSEPRTPGQMYFFRQLPNLQVRAGAGKLGLRPRRDTGPGRGFAKSPGSDTLTPPSSVFILLLQIHPPGTMISAFCAYTETGRTPARRTKTMTIFSNIGAPFETIDFIGVLLNSFVCGRITRAIHGKAM
jgi:hypothetical protein